MSRNRRHRRLATAFRQETRSCEQLRALLTNMMERGPGGLDLVDGATEQDANQSKIRFDNAFLPLTVNEYFKMVCAAVDKQMFLDRALD